MGEGRGSIRSWFGGSEDRSRVLTMPVSEAFAFLAIPAVGSTLFSILFEIVDMFWAGKLGSRPVAALSVASFFVWMLRALAQTVSTGAIAMISRRTGERDTVRLVRTAVHALTASVVFSIVVMAICFPLASRIFLWIRLDRDVAGDALSYTVAFLSGLVFVYGMTTAEHILRGMGNTRIPMLLMGFSLLLNAVLDPVFMFTFRMGLAGAAWATVFSQAVGCLLMVAAIRRVLPEFSQGKPQLSVPFFRDYFWPMVRIGSPVAMSGAGFSVIYLFLTAIISRFGSEPLAALGIGHRIEAFPFYVSFGFSLATAALVGQNLGARRFEQAKVSVHHSLRLASAILFVFSVIFFFGAKPLYGFFISDPVVIGHGVRYLRTIAVCEVFLGFEVILEGAFSGAGDTKPPFLVVFPITFLRIPLSYILGIRFGLGLQAVWGVISATTAVKGVLLWIWFRKDRWMRKAV